MVKDDKKKKRRSKFQMAAQSGGGYFSRYNRRPARGRKTNTNNQNIGILKAVGFPKKMFVKLKYVENLKANTCTGGASYYYLYNLNGLYDVDATVGGHQPMAFDQWANFYNQYLVLGAKVKYSAYNATNTIPIKCVLNTLPTTSGGPSNLNDAHESLRTGKSSGKYKDGANQQAVLHISRYFRPWDVRGVSKTQYINEIEDYGAAFTANPSKIMSLQTWCQPMDEASTITINHSIEFTFYVQLGQPKFLAQS